MSLKAKIEAVIYAAEEPVTLQQLVSLLGQEAQAELDAASALQGQLALSEAEPILLIADEPGDQDALNAEMIDTDEVVAPESTTGSPEVDRSGAVEGTSFLSGISKGQTEAPGSPDQRTGEPADAAGQSALASEEPTPAEQRARERRLREYMRFVLDRLIADYAGGDRGLEIREIAGGFRFATKPEYHDAVRGFVRSLKPPLKLSLQALETLAVVAYKQPVTAPEVSEIRGVDTGGVLGSLMTRKLVTTAGRKQVIGRPILYKTTKEFLLRFGLKDLLELPSIEEFERMAGALNEAVQEEIPMADTPVVPVGTAVNERPLSPEEVAHDVEPSRNEHSAQADGDPNPSTLSADEVDDEHLTPAPDGPGEFTGNENVPPADNVEVDGRISGVPPTYDAPGDEATDSPAHDAEVQSEQMGNAGEDD
ncbi:MAG: SMC-Scp complex subunit ScpB [Janthinobacterium lividum]